MACFWSAWARFSAGRSRGSWTASAATIISISSIQSKSLPATSMRASLGSIGIRAIFWPIRVSLTSFKVCLESGFLLSGFLGARAPSSSSSLRPSFTKRLSGGSIKSKFSTVPKRRLAICRITDAKLVRRISGSVYSGRLSKSSCEYRRIHTPGATRPQRPLRWLAAACEIASIGKRCTRERYE